MIVFTCTSNARRRHVHLLYQTFKARATHLCSHALFDRSLRGRQLTARSGEPPSRRHGRAVLRRLPRLDVQLLLMVRHLLHVFPNRSVGLGRYSGHLAKLELQFPAVSPLPCLDSHLINIKKTCHDDIPTVCHM